MARTAHAPLRPQLVQQLFFQHSTGLNEQAAVDGFVGHAQALVIGILDLQPSGNLLGRPVQDQFTRNDIPQLAVEGKQTPFQSQGREPSLVIGIMGAIGSTSTVAGDLSAYRRRGATQQSSYFTNRRSRSESARDVFSLR